MCWMGWGLSHAVCNATGIACQLPRCGHTRHDSPRHVVVWVGGWMGGLTVLSPHLRSKGETDAPPQAKCGWYQTAECGEGLIMLVSRPKDASRKPFCWRTKQNLSAGNRDRVWWLIVWRRRIGREFPGAWDRICAYTWFPANDSRCLHDRGTKSRHACQQFLHPWHNHLVIANSTTRVTEVSVDWGFN